MHSRGLQERLAMLATHAVHAGLAHVTALSHGQLGAVQHAVQAVRNAQLL